MNELAVNYLHNVLSKLLELAQDISSPLPHLPDKKIATSALQKGIRRGNVELVVRALETLWTIDSDYTCRILATIAFDDVGIADPDLVGATVLACSGSKHLGKDRLYRAARACAIALAKSPKERSTDYIYTALACHPDLELLRDRFAHKSTEQLVDLVLDTECYLLERSTAAWYLAGTEGHERGHMLSVVGDMEAFEWVVKQLNIPLWHPLVTMEGLDVTESASPIFWPIKLSHGDCGVGKVRYADKLLQDDNSNVPSYLLDHLTCGGKAVIKELLQEDSLLTRWLGSKLHPDAWQATVEEGLFYVSGEVMDQDWVFFGGTKIRRLATEAACSKAGLSMSDVSEGQIVGNIIEDFLPFIQVMIGEAVHISELRAFLKEKELI